MCQVCYFKMETEEVLVCFYTKNRSKVDRISSEVLCYFPLTKRMQQFHTTEDITKSIRWHAQDRVDDGKLRNPTDVEAWMYLDHIFFTFRQNSQKVRLGLASNGFNPFGINSSGCLTWHVILMPYNMPTWICMNQP